MEETLKDSPAILPNLRRVQGRKLSAGHRSITMLRPHCAFCQGPNTAPGWQRDCPHDPYMSVVEETWSQPEYEDEVGPDGTRVVKGTKTSSRPVARPNWVEISVTNRINGGVGVQVARNKGFIRPSELRNEAYPNGIAECCEWSDCKWQQGLKDYKDGRFCRDIEARHAAIDARGVGQGRQNFEIGHDARSMEIRQAQLADAVIN